MKHIEYTYTRGMDDSELEERLRSTDTGILSLARDGEAYAIPLAHYFDGEGLYFRLGITEKSAKQAYWENTETARYVLYEAEPTDDPREIDSWSVIVTGRLVELPAEKRERFDTAEINRQFAPIRVFEEDIDEIEIVIAEFEIETMTGRITPGE